MIIKASITENQSAGYFIELQSGNPAGILDTAREIQLPTGKLVDSLAVKFS